MAQFGDENGTVNPPVAEKKPTPGNGAVNLETHLEESVSNGNCMMTDSVKRGHNDIGHGPPVSDNMGVGEADTKPIPRRSSIIKV